MPRIRIVDLPATLANAPTLRFVDLPRRQQQGTLQSDFEDPALKLVDLPTSTAYYPPQPHGQQLVAHADRGANYDVSEDELMFLQNEDVGPHTPGWRPPPPQKISRERALDRLNVRTTMTPAVGAAVQRFHAALSMPGDGFDLAINMFNDLDTILFHGDLKRRVNARWADLRYDPVIANSATNSPSQTLAATNVTYDSRYPRIWLRLNAHSPLWGREKKFVLGTLVHEMIHAYFYVHCGEHGCDDVVTERGMDEGHGFFFHEARKRIEGLTGLHLWP